MELNIIYKDKDFLVLNKPAGIVVHPDKNHVEDTLIQEVVKKNPEIKDVGDHSTSSWQARPGVVHRLDKDTSGLLVVARNQDAFVYLKSLFQNRGIKKIYLVLVSGIVKDDNGVIDLPIGRSRKDPRRRIAWPEHGRRPGKGASGKLREATTEYKVIRRFHDFTLLEARLITGRTHQIRAHFSAISRPVACDRIYGGKNPACPAGLARQFLHAWKLEFISPSGAKMSFEADLPDDLEKVLKFLNIQT